MNAGNLKRTVFMISDGTGITVESLTNSLISQFETIQFEKKIYPFIDSIDKIKSINDEIEQWYATYACRPLVFMTLVNAEMRALVKQVNACVFDLFDTFLSPMEVELGIKASDTIGRAHALSNNTRYDERIDAVNFALAYDDGSKFQGYDHADIILVGVSRSGKTPSCLYMALQFGVFAANYPFTIDELAEGKLPAILRPYKKKLFGLTIDPVRLQSIRHERRPNTSYSSLEQCRREVREVEMLYQYEKIPFLDSTHFSIEEIAAKIMTIENIKRRI